MANNKNCKTCELNKNGCMIENDEGFRIGSCGAWVKKKN